MFVKPDIGTELDIELPTYLEAVLLPLNSIIKRTSKGVLNVPFFSWILEFKLTQNIYYTSLK